ncbi:DUF2244 domain-containing protein [Granulosicoccus antarcticus]|uniref:DUF2244 domain-containing protein n=1 Tax=Granulosicoccus antarcticus IMCC3135 TaxID=1192854 RepID=A0A2Z2NU29_9GAMM|nr:DUF2244 domain-containing protein [Granulosicoccus antarcticus]ASJ71147.1 hypothetical protein IMCC3135_05170 [Granulosicoccus antarcticus IMCC3135]
MIEVQDEKGVTVRLIVTPNRSMSWRANLYLAASLGFICMGMALVLASFGLWMVVPFAGAEVLLIITCLYLTLKRLSRKEVITVDNEAIRLEWGYNHPEVIVNLPRRWTRLSYNCPESLFEVGHLSVAAHGKHYTLGRCLNKVEKKALFTELKIALNR